MRLRHFMHKKAPLFFPAGRVILFSDILSEFFDFLKRVMETFRKRSSKININPFMKRFFVHYNAFLKKSAKIVKMD